MVGDSSSGSDDVILIEGQAVGEMNDVILVEGSSTWSDDVILAGGQAVGTIMSSCKRGQVDK